jgi:hypothetical protein
MTSFIKVLWIDDEHEKLNAVKAEAKLNGIDLVGFKSLNSGLKELEDHFPIYDGVLFDAKFFEDDNNIPGTEDTEYLHRAKERLLKIPKPYSIFVLTGQAEAYGEYSFKKAFKEVYMAVKRELPKDMQDKLESSRKEIKTVDDLSRILNELFSKYGNTLDQNFMIFTYGGRVHLWVLLEDAFKELLVDNLIETFKEKNVNASRFFELLVENYGEQTMQEMIDNKDGIGSGLLVDPDDTNF